MKKTIDGVLAGMSISIGGAAFLMCYEDNKYIGALLFCIGLLSVCWFGFSLYTGKIGFILEAHSKEDISVLLLGLLGNAIGAIACGYLLAYAIPQIGNTAKILAEAKLAQGYFKGFLRGIFCGILIYVAVYIFKSKKTPLGIILGIPAFIISGYEHSIADMFYFAASGVASIEAFGYIMLIVLGNSVGGLVIPALQLLSKVTFKKKVASASAVAEVASDVQPIESADNAPQTTEDNAQLAGADDVQQAESEGKTPCDKPSNGEEGNQNAVEGN